jgi:hypothetical protein
MEETNINQREDEGDLIAQKLDNFVNTKKFSFEGLTELDLEFVVPFLSERIQEIVENSSLNDSLFIGLKFTDGGETFYNLHNPNFYIPFMKLFGKKQFLMVDRVNELSGQDSDVIFRTFSGFEIVNNLYDLSFASVKLNSEQED